MGGCPPWPIVFNDMQCSEKIGQMIGVHDPLCLTPNLGNC